MKNKKKNIHLLGFVLVIILVYVLIDIAGLRHSMFLVHNWIDSFGYWAPAVFFVIFVMGIVFIIPVSVLCVASSIMFGSLVGTIVASLGSMLGGGICFLIARYLARDYVLSMLEKSGRLKKLDEMTQKYGAYIVAVSRIVPISPGAILNYGFGLTKVRFSTFLFWTWLGMAPEIIAYVVGTNVIYRMILTHKIHWNKVIVFMLVALCIITITISVKKYLSDKTVIDSRK